MENLGIEKQEWLGTFLALPNGIPDSDTFNRVFEKVNPQELSKVFREDAYRAKRDHSPLNLNVLRKTALPLLQAADFGRMGIRKKMFRTAMSIPSLKYILTGEK